MLPVYKNSQVKVVHFDIDKNKTELESYLTSKRNEFVFVNTELLPKYSIYDMLDDPHDCRLEVRFTFRIFDKEDKISFGSYVSEQFFYIKYVEDNHTKAQIKNLFANSFFMSEQVFANLIEKNNLPKQIRFNHYTFPDSVQESVFDILKGKVQQK